MKSLPILLLASLPLLSQDLRLMSDTSTRASMPDTPLGSLPQLAVDATSTTYLQFDTFQIANTQRPEDLISATLRLYINRLSTPGAISVAAYCRPVQEDWLTHNNRQLPLCSPLLSTLPVTSAQNYLDIDVTERVRNALNIGTALSLLITPSQSAPSTSVLFDSKESTTTSHSPQLMLNFKPLLLVGPTGPRGPTGPIGPQGPTGFPGAPASFSGVVWKSDRLSCSSSSVCSVSRSCSAGQVLVAGGCGHRDYNSATPDIRINYSGPRIDGPRTDNGSVVVGWTCNVNNWDSFASRDYEIWYACAPAN
jgi:hypothetical protein